MATSEKVKFCSACGTKCQFTEEDRPVFMQSRQCWRKLYIWELVWRGHQSKCYPWQHSSEKFFCTTVTNQDGNFELESPTNCETWVCSERLENAKPAAITSTVPIASTKHTDNNEEPIASVLSTPKVSSAQSNYYPIFQPSINTSPTFSPIKVGKNTEIEEHADLCFTRKTQRNIIDVTNDSDAEDTTSYIDLNGNDTDKSDTTNTKSQFLSKIKSVLKNTIFTNGKAKLNIERNFSFVDFCNYFTKTWNKPKLNMMYRE